jgi:hypothetical protein
MKNAELTIFLSALGGESQNHLSINDCVRNVRNCSRNADGSNISCVSSIEYDRARED